MPELEKIFARILVYPIYCGLLGWGLASITGNNALNWIGNGAFAGALGFILTFVGSWWVLVWALIWSLGLASILILIGALILVIALILALISPNMIDVDDNYSKKWNSVLVLAGESTLVFSSASLGMVGTPIALGLALALILRVSANYNNTTPELLIDKHVEWLLSFPITLIHFLSHLHTPNKTYLKSQVKHRAWDVSLVVSFTQELAIIFPEEWDEWQHWISDMMESRTRMQSKGMNHRLVSLITFYRLTRFVWHIGIDKVFILATRRTTR
jgi:hypothetical protein